MTVKLRRPARASGRPRFAEGGAVSDPAARPIQRVDEKPEPAHNIATRALMQSGIDRPTAPQMAQVAQAVERERSGRASPGHAAAASDLAAALHRPPPRPPLHSTTDPSAPTGFARGGAVSSSLPPSIRAALALRGHLARGGAVAPGLPAAPFAAAALPAVATPGLASPHGLLSARHRSYFADGGLSLPPHIAAALAARHHFDGGGAVSPVDQNALAGDAFAYDQAPDQLGALKGNVAAMGQAAGRVAIGTANGIADAVTYPRDVMQGRVDPQSDEGIGRTLGMAGLMAGPGLGMAEEGAAGAMGGRLRISAGGEIFDFNKAQAQSWADHFDQRAVALRASGADPVRIAEAENQGAALRAALPQFDAMPAGDVGQGTSGGRFSPAKILPAGDRAVTVATDPRHNAFDDVRTYRAYAKPEAGLDGVTRARDLGRQLGYADMKLRDDGRWEVGMVNVNPASRGQGVARDLYAGIEADLGQKMQPSGVLLPDGHAMWQRRDPTAVQWHQPVQAGDGSVYHLSPRYMQEHAGAWSASDPTFDSNMASALDRVPAAGKTPQAIAQMFSGGLPIPGSAPAVPASMQPTPEMFGRLLREGKAT